jgi:membrane protein implicated in regulation of membrane protease activity
VASDYFGEEATVVVPIEPDRKGRICLYGVYWPARAKPHVRRVIPAEAIVRVVERRGLTLIVEPKAMGGRGRER